MMGGEHSPKIPRRHPRTGWLILLILLALATGVWMYATPGYVKYFLAEQSISEKQTEIVADGTVPGRKQDELAIVFFDVKFGEGILVQSPDNVTSLIDGGEGQFPESDEAPVYDWAYRLYLPLLNKIGKHDFKNFISTTPASHHMGVQPDLMANKKVTVENVYWTGYEAQFSAHRRFRLHAKNKANVQILETGDKIEFGPGTESKVLHANQDAKVRSRTSRVIYLKYGRKRFLFMSDLPREEEENLVLRWGKSLNSDVIKLGNHGSDDSTSSELLKYVKPEHAVISVSDKNPLGAPSEAVISNLKREEVSVHKTSEKGHVAMYTDGESIRIEHRVFPFLNQ